MLVHDDFRLSAGSTETVPDKIDLGLHDREIILRPALQHKARAQRRKIGNAGDVQEDILGKYRGEAGENFFGLPPLPLEIDDIRLHEHSAAIAKNGHGLRGEGQIGELIDIEPETFRGGLQEVPVSGGALGIELEIFYATVMQNDDLDVLAADVHDDMRVFVEFQGGFGVRDGFDQGDVGLEDVP